MFFKENLKLKAVNGSITIDKSHVKSNVSEDKELLERQKRLIELRDKLKAKDAEMSTPRSKELFNELDKFRPKTASNFRPEF